MDPVSGLNQIIGLLRQRVNDKSAKPQKSTSSSLLESGKKTSAEPSIDELRRHVNKRIGSLPEEERTGDKATQIFVESILTWEFGEELLNDPGFTEMTDSILQSINASKELRTQFDRFLGSL